VALIGQGALILALLIAIYSAGAALWAATGRDRRLLVSARHGLWAVLALVLIADAIFLYALFTHDFSFKVVSDTSSRSLPTVYLITAWWGSQAGSLLLWSTLLAICSLLGVRSTRNVLGELQPWMIMVLALISTFFLVLLVVPASPFVTQVAPADGLGLNPSLQNPYMALHPPSLYLGYVGLAIPFALAMAAMLAGRTDARWVVASRRWTLAAWGFLGIGMLLGSHWAYTEVGWGGFWAWDPVENAALMPWLVATAFLHSVMVQERKGMLKVWNISLIAGAFALSIFGTFLTRSGILSSIHAFVASDIGWYFMVALVLIIGGSFALIMWRLPQLKADRRMESLVSREATFLFNNLLLVGIAFAVLWGVVYPLLTEAVGQVRESVSTPFYEFFVIVFGLPLLLLMGIGPLIAWRRASLRQIRTTFLWPFLGGLATGIAMVAFGLDSSWPGVAAGSICAFVTVTIISEFVRGTVARHRVAEESWPIAFLHLIDRNRRRYGGYIVHLGVIVFVVGAVGASAYETSGQGVLKKGETLTIGSNVLTFEGVEQTQGPNYRQRAAVLNVVSDGEEIGTLKPAKRSYIREQTTSNEVAIHTTLTQGDLFIILDGIRVDGAVQIKTFYKPVVGLLWIAGFLFAGGVLLCVWPDPRERKRIAKRYGEETLPGES
jgi:cytochrome c-type biogenesis protein CcmF